MNQAATLPMVTEIVLKVSTFIFWEQKLADVTLWSKILSPILITIIEEEPWLS